MTEFTLNGEAVRGDAVPRTPLLYVLREEFAINGARYGCGLGQCGACTVLVDGKPVLSCLVPVSLAANRAVETTEGLGTAAEPGPVQRAFIDEQAAQCGYCIPGIVMRTEALLRDNPDADEDEIRDALKWNLCRCGTHMRILRAVKRAQGYLAEAEA